MNTLKILLLALPLSLAGCSSCNAPDPDDYVEVSGEGSVTGTPDLFGARAVAAREGRNIARLKDQVNAEVDTILALAGELGIADEQITASAIRVSPQWQYQPERKLTGYRVERPVQIDIHGIATYAELVTGLADAGITEIQGTGARISNSDELEQQALEAAVADARRRAEVLAAAGDRDLGEALRIHSAASGAPSPMRMEMASTARDSGSWEPGEQTVRQQVTVRFRLH
jgi:uncharacterized protein YggE